MSDFVKLLNEFKNGYLSMCIRLLNLFEAEKGGVTVWSSLGYSVGFFFHFRMWHPTQNLQLLLQIEETSLLLSIYKLKITDSI